MSSQSTGHFVQSPEITGVVEKIVELLSPSKIYLYNQRINSMHVTTSFKLCVIAQVPDKFAAERDIFMEIDSDIPFDILLYTPEEWEGLTAQADSFASRIRETGTVAHDV